MNEIIKYKIDLLPLPNPLEIPDFQRAEIYKRHQVGEDVEGETHEEREKKRQKTEEATSQKQKKKKENFIQAPWP